DLHGLGGICRYSGYATDVQRSVIAWGGVIAQAGLFAATNLLVSVFPALMHTKMRQALEMFLGANLLLIALNLLPIARFDGREAWALFRWTNLSRAWSRWQKKARAFRVKQSLRRAERTVSSAKRGSESEDPRDWLN